MDTKTKLTAQQIQDYRTALDLITGLGGIMQGSGIANMQEFKNVWLGFYVDAQTFLDTQEKEAENGI